MDTPHEYGPSRVGHGEAQCIHCYGTNRENAIIAPNHCAERAKKAISASDMFSRKSIEDIIVDLHAVKAHHEFTRDRVGHPGSQIRATAAEFIATIDRAESALRKLAASSDDLA